VSGPAVLGYAARDALPTETILLSSAAASIQPIWQIMVGVTFVASLLGICIAGPITVVVAWNTASR